jgi:FkbM family methyltransferase
VLRRVSPRRFARRWLERIGNALIGLGRAIYQSPAERRMGAWWAAGKADALVSDYDLDERSLIVELGGYKGQWTADAFAAFGCRIHVFEPVAEFAEAIRRRFARNPRIVVHQCALAAATGTAQIGLCREGSSLYDRGSLREEIRLVRAADWFDANGIGEVDLLEMNIEGAEYDLLEHLIDTGIIRRIRYLLVQFHDCVPDAARRLAALEQRLRATHEPQYQFPFLWESWRRLTSCPRS